MQFLKEVAFKLRFAETSPTGSKLRVASLLVGNPLENGRPRDVAESTTIANGEGCAMLVVDADESDPEGAGIVASRFRDSLKLVGRLPTLDESMRSIASTFEGTKALATIGVTTTLPEKAEKKLLVGSSEAGDNVLVVDSITHRVVSQGPQEETRFGGVDYKVFSLHPDRIYMLLGSGVTGNVDSQELQRILSQAGKENDRSGVETDLGEFLKAMAGGVTTKIERGRQRIGRRVYRPFLNDIGIAALSVPGAVVEANREPGEKSTFADLMQSILRFLETDGGRRLEVSRSLIEIRDKLSESLSLRERSVLLGRLDHLAKGDQNRESLKLLNALLSGPDSADVGYKLVSSDLDGKKIPGLLNRDAIWDMVSVMLDHRQSFHSALGIILAEVPLDAIPERVRVKLGDVPKTFDMEVLPWFERWYLCDVFAARMKKSLRVNGLIYVNGIPIKFLGKMSGVVLDTVTDDKGEETLLEGSVVSPVDKRQRELIKREFDLGVPNIEVQGLKLAYMRPWSEGSDGQTWDEMRKRIIRHRSNLPTRFSGKIGGLSRKKWREHEDEGF